MSGNPIDSKNESEIRLQSVEHLNPLSKQIFPAGAFLTILGVLLCAALEKYSYHETRDWIFEPLSVAFFAALCVGTPLAIVGAFIDRRRLPVADAREKGLLCWHMAGISAALLGFVGNLHTWTFTFFFPAVVGFLAGAVLLSKNEDRHTA